MKTDAHEYFEIHVVPNLDAWMAQPTDIRLAMSATVALYHMADHFWHAYSASDPSRVFCTANSALFRSELAKQNEDFRVLRDVAEAHKHMELERSSRVLTQANQTVVGATGFGEAGFGTGPFAGGPSVVVELDDGSKHHLSYLADQVKRFWVSNLT
jgi:hypothetical protein